MDVLEEIALPVLKKINLKNLMVSAATAMTGMMGGTASAAAKATSAGVSMLINAYSSGVKIYNNPEDSFNYTDFMMSGATGWFSAGTGAVRSSVISVSTAYTGSVLQNEDPTAAVAGR
jgi:hypothetical protein